MADERNEMEEDYAPDLLSLLDDEGVEHNFEILDAVEDDEGRRFLALLPQFDEPQKAVDSDGVYYIFEVFEEDGEEQLAEVEDEDLANELAAIFEERFAALEEQFYDEPQPEGDDQ